MTPCTTYQWAPAQPRGVMGVRPEMATGRRLYTLVAKTYTAAITPTAPYCAWMLTNSIAEYSAQRVALCRYCPVLPRKTARNLGELPGLDSWQG